MFERYATGQEDRGLAERRGRAHGARPCVRQGHGARVRPFVKRYFEGSDGGQTLVRHRIDSEKATSQLDITHEVIRHHPVRDKTNDRDQTSFATALSLEAKIRHYLRYLRFL
jgi:hypothetical protein